MRMPDRQPLIDSQGSADGVTVSGEWTLARVTQLRQQLDLFQRSHGKPSRVDASALLALDTVGATALLDLAGEASIDGLGGARKALLDAVVQAATQPAPPPRLADTGLTGLLASIGETIATLGSNAVMLVGFIGMVLARIFTSLNKPRTWRVTSLVFHIEQTGLNAVPIIMLLNFLVGAVIAFLGATVLRDFGASMFAIDLVGFSFLREFGVLLTAILVAGRSGSAFTAQIGAMKLREEIDAIRTLGLDPIVVLVLPRTLALLVTLPLLTFLAMIAGIVGGAAVCVWSLDITPTMFITRFNELGMARHFWVGMSKAPIFAVLIATIGCLEGFKVSGSAESLGARTTSSVVQGIFVVILIDALAAIFFMEMQI